MKLVLMAVKKWNLGSKLFAGFEIGKSFIQNNSIQRRIGY
jgi:hypothetical protein